MPGMGCRMTQLTVEERTAFYEKATALLAHREQLELIAEGGRNATQNEILSPIGELALVLIQGSPVHPPEPEDERIERPNPPSRPRDHG